MRPPVWRPPVEPSPAEQRVIGLVRRAKLFVWLRQHRHELLDDGFQTELAAAYQHSPKGQPPVPPAQLALATILQAYTGASDDEVVEATVMDRRWQLVLDCLDGERAALDASPLWGAGRVEDTINLLGHALRTALGVIARQQGRGLSWHQGVAAVADQAGVGLLGASSLKAALDRDWDDPLARDQALGVVLEALEQVEGFVDDHQLAGPGVEAALGAARQVRDQDVQVADEGPPTLKRGVATDRRISIEDPQMRHGRKSRSHLIDGYKRHVLRELDFGLVPAVGVTAANLPEAHGATQIRDDLAAQQLTLAELFIDRAYLSSVLVQDRPDGLAVFCKAWRVHNGPRFAKTDFTLDWDQQQLVCPAGQQMPFVPGGKVQFHD